MPRHIPLQTTLELEPYQVVVKPLVTEKGVEDSNENNAYAFEIHKLATKSDVRRAVEELFDVKVVKVTIQNRKGKPRRTKQGFSHTASWKKAIVKLDDEHRIDFF